MRRPHPQNLQSRNHESSTSLEDMILLYSDETQVPDFAPGSPEFEAMMGYWMAFNQTLIDSGQFVSGEAADLDAAIEIAHRVPIPAGSFEVRPVGFRPDAAGAPQSA